MKEIFSIKIDNSFKISTSARWIYVLALAIIGIISKYYGMININFSPMMMSVLIIVAVSYNLIPQYLSSHNYAKLKPRALSVITVCQLLLDIIIITIVIHYAGGIESISFIFYFFIIISASFIYKKWGVYLISLLCLLAYDTLIYAEYFQLLPHATRYPFSNQSLYSSSYVVILNTLTVSFVLIACGFFVGYLSNLRAQMEERAQAELKKRLEEKKSMEEIKSKFITVLTHQSRTPLNHIKLDLEALTEEGLTDKHLVYTEDAQIALERILVLFDRLLKMQDLEKHDKIARLEKIPMKPLVNKCIDELHFLAKRKKVDFSFSTADNVSMDCYGDPMLIHTVVEALVENAIDYSKPESIIEIKLCKKDDFIELSVKDEGLTINSADREKIFNKFFRTDEAIRTITDKSGLSLYLAKLIMEKHSGSIWCDSTPEGVTTFFISLHSAE
jgi:signal transduction histidine kinase